MSDFTFEKMVAMLAARCCYESGQSVAQIAKSAKKSEATIRQWLEEAGTRLWAS